MLYIKKFNEYKPINELFVHSDDREDLDGKNFILYKKDVWIFDDDEWEENEIWEDINNAIGEDVAEEDYYETQITIKEKHPYILQGTINDGNIYIDEYPNYRHGSLSTDLKKLSDELGLEVKASYNKGAYNDESAEYDIEFYEKIEDAYFYHGTCLKYLDGISKKGIIPFDENTNFDSVKHSDKIFVTTNMEKALFHANTASLKNKSFPVILKFKLPDTSKLVIDYDLGMEFYGVDNKINQHLGYSDIYNKTGGTAFDNGAKILSDSEKIDISRKLGLYGYKGRIPANRIEVHIDLDTLNKYWEIFDDDYGYEQELENDNEMWDEIHDIDMWSELTSQEAKSRIEDIEDEYREQFDGEEEDEEEDDEY